MMHSSAWRPLVRAALVPALVLCAAPAFAQTPANPADDPTIHHMTVSFADLDLATAKGRTVLERRLRRSASAVCNYDLSENAHLASAEERACYTTAMAHARGSMAAAITKTRMASSQ